MRHEQSNLMFQPSANMVSRGNQGRRGQGDGGGRGRGRGGGRGQYQYQGANYGNQHGSGNNHGGNKGSDNRPVCQLCGKIGHVAFKCYKRFDHAFQQEERMVANVTTGSGSDAPWYTDTGATDHITGELNKLAIHERYSGKDRVHTANGSGMPIAHIGSSKIHTSHKPLFLNNVLHIPRTNKNLLFVHKLTADNNVCLEFHPDCFLIKDRTSKKVLLRGPSEGGLYPQNSSAGRKHRHIVEVGLSLLAHASMPVRFWDEAFQTTCFLINRLPSRTIQNSTPLDRLFGTSPDYSFLRTFGCA